MPSIKDLIKMALKNLIDELNRFLIVVFLILFVTSFFIKNFYLDISKFIILGIIVFRIASKNKISRAKENKIFLNIKNFIFHPFSNHQKKSKKDKNTVYKKCPKCHTILKLPLPKKRGINHVKCPNCEYRLTLLSLRKKKKEKIKVEVIKKHK